MSRARSLVGLLVLLLVVPGFAARGAASFSGKGVGKWDNTFQVQVTVTPVQGAPEVIYEWQEQEGRKTLERRLSHGEIRDGAPWFRGSEMHLDPEGPNRAKEVGHYAQELTAG